MSAWIESAVEKSPEKLVKSGASGNQHVLVTILNDDEAAKLEELRRLIDEAEGSGESIDGEEAFAQLRCNLVEKYPKLADAAPEV